MTILEAPLRPKDLTSFAMADKANVRMTNRHAIVSNQGRNP
jgi:hypothetical protein